MEHCESCGAERRKYRNDRAQLCAPVQLELSRGARLRLKLRRLISYAGLPVVVFGEWVLGRDPRTLQRWLAGEKIPHSASIWIDRLELVELRGAVLVLELRWGNRRPRWRFSQEQKKRTLYKPARG